MREIFRKVGLGGKIGYSGQLAIYVLLILLLAYLLPVIIHFRPFGMDVYSHMVYTKKVFDAGSMPEFYRGLPFEMDESQEDDLGYGYPFGLWYFGALMAKIMGIEPFQVAYIIPLALVGIICLVYYSFSRLFIDSHESALLSVAFLLSIPVVSIALLSYRSSVFATIFLLLMLYLSHNNRIRMRKSVPLLILCVFALCVSHTGTYIFALSFILAYIFLKSAIWGMFQRRMYALLTIMLVVYVLTIGIFPSIHLQYTTKAAFFTTIAGLFSSMTHLPFVAELGNLFFSELFLNASIINALKWSLIVYALCKLAIYAREKTIENAQRLRRRENAIPSMMILGNLKNVSHSVLATPFWAGPQQMFLSVFGYFRLNVKGKCMILSTVIITLVPGAIHTGSTGALREIYYLLVILPISASAGLPSVLERIERYGSRVGQRVRSAAAYLLLFGVFSASILAPAIGNIYYLPTTSGDNYELMGLSWLNGVGNPDEVVIGVGYRNMVDVYANKSNPRLRQGTETITFLQDMLNTFFSRNGSEYVDGLYYTFRGSYVVSSPRVIKELQSADEMVRQRRTLDYDKPEILSLDNITALDRIYSSENGFTIYQYIPPEYGIRSLSDSGPGIAYIENDTEVRDAGVVFDVQTDTYNIQLDKKTPSILYLRSKDTDFISEGYLQDQVGINFIGGLHGGTYQTYQFDQVAYPKITLRGNKLTYETTLKDQDGTNLATMTVEYTFYQKAVKKEITVSNDWIDGEEDMTMGVLLYNSQFAPQLPYLTYYSPEGFETNKTIYPSEDTVKLQDLDFTGVFINNGATGLYYGYGGTSQDPDEIRYKGSTAYNYSYSSVGLKGSVGPSESMRVTQFISVGNRSEARDNANAYSGVDVYPYSRGIIPVLIEGYEDEPRNQSLLRNNTFGGLRILNITYQYGVNPTNAEVLSNVQNPNIGFVGHENIHSAIGFDNRSVLTQKLARLRVFEQTQGIQSRGFIPGGMVLNLQTVGILSANNAGYIIAEPTGSFYGPYYQMWARSPRFISYNGTDTKIVLLPVSTPLGKGLNSSEMGVFISEWQTLLNASASNDGMNVMFWQPEYLSGDYWTGLAKIIDYGREKGLTFTTADEVAEHYRLAHGIATNVTLYGGKVVFSAHNLNGQGIKGMTYVTRLPAAGGACNYAAEGAELVRTNGEQGICRVYVSVDLNADETKRFTIGAA